MSQNMDPPATGPKLFISYCCSDLNPTMELDAHLRERGVHTFLHFEDRHGFKPGQILPENVLQELGWCDFCLLVWSQLAAISDWVSSEIKIAIDFGKPLLVYRLDNTALTPEIASMSSFVTDENETDLIALFQQIYGDHPIPPISVSSDILFEPGQWQIDINDILQSVTFKLHLYEDGTLRGKREQGNIAGQVTGGWTYDQSNNMLTMKLEIRVGLRPDIKFFRVHLTKQLDRVLYGEDLYALGPVVRHYALHPIQLE